MQFDAHTPILVTGASGVMGTALQGVLTRLGYKRVHSMSAADGDLRDARSTEALFERLNPKLVFHLAARVSGIMGNMKNRSAAYYDNILINTNLIEASRRFRVSKIVAMGTTAIYSDDISLPMSESDIWTGPPHLSERPYGQAKRAMLAQLEANYEQDGIEFAYAISTNLYGENDRFDENFGHVVPSLISKFHRARGSGEDVTVWGDGSPRRDFLYSGDAARALVHIAQAVTGPINLASGTTVSIREAVETLREISKFTGNVKWDTSKPNGQKFREYNIEKLRSTGFRTEFSLRDGLKKTWDWYETNYKSARR